MKSLDKFYCRFCLLFVLLIFISFSFVIAFNVENKNILKVTGEHPFYVNNTWVVANDLNAGDELLTVDGKIARIISIKDADETVNVYNIKVDNYEDYFADGILVHNKPVPNKYLDPEFAGVKQVSPLELDLLYEEKAALDMLVGQESGIVKNDLGNIKEVYLIDASKVDLDILPERIRYLAENSDGPIALKYYRQESRLTRVYYPDEKLDDFIAELEISERLNARFETEGMKPLLPKKSLIGISADSENGNIFVKGFIAEELIPEKSVVELRIELEDFYLDKEVDFGRVLELESRINSKLSESRYTFDKIFEQEGIGWYDADDRNTAIGFIERGTGKILSLTQVLDGNYVIGKAPNSGDIEVYIRFFEIGFGRQVEPGKGYFGGFVDCYFH